MDDRKCKACKKVLSAHHGTTNESPKHPGYCYECGEVLDEIPKRR